MKRFVDRLSDLVENRKPHGLTQAQVPEVGNQSVVSQVLAGKRQLNTRQIARLCARFGVGAGAFIPDASGPST